LKFTAHTLRRTSVTALLLIGSGLCSAAFAQGQTPSGVTLLPPKAPLTDTLPNPPASNTQSATTQPPAGEPTDAVRAAYDQAFQASLNNPSDPQTLVHFAETAVAFGDIEGAISAFERLLLIDGDQPDVKLELGVLYYRLGSTEAARAYLQDVTKSTDASAESKERANTFLAEMKKP